MNRALRSRIILPLLIIGGLLFHLGCAEKKPVESAPPPPERIQVDVRAEPEQATIQFKGKPLGATPQSLRVADEEDLLSITAFKGTDSFVEKRVRFISPEKAEIIFFFGQSATAKRLGLPRVLVFEFGAGLSFDVNKFEVKSVFEPFLDRQAKMLNERFSTLDIFLCGHTDSTGLREANLLLSLKRAQAVADSLSARRVVKTRMKVQGLGSEYPIASNDTPENRTINRRTEIILPQ